MKAKRFVYSFVFLGGFVLLLFIMSFVLTPARKDAYDVRGSEYLVKLLNREKANSIDVLFLGDSLTYSAFCPLLMYKSSGITSYVEASSAQKMCDSKYILEQAVKKQTPKIVFIETGILFRNARGMDEKGEDIVKDYLEENFSTFKYHEQWKTIAVKYLKRGAKKGKAQRQKGYKYRATRKPYVGGDYMIENNEKEDFADEVAEYLEQIRAICDEKGIDMVLISVPSPVNWNMAKHNAVEQYANQNDLKFIDLNLEELGINWDTDTKDKGDHLNFYGACKATKFLEGYLKNAYSFEDHRKDSAFADWDKASDKFYKKRIENKKRASYAID